jgi:hypothetical protein
VSRFARLLAFVAPVGLTGLAGGCYINDPDHCVNKGCEDTDFPYCSRCVTSELNGGCVKDPPEMSCWVEPVDTAAATEGTTAGTAGTAGSDSADTEPMPTTGAACMSEGIDPMCDASAPYCIDGACSPCTAGADDYCGSIDSDAPVCFSTGICTACSDTELALCGGTTPACNAAGECSGCTSHQQCAAISPDETLPQGCNLETGACLDGAAYWVDSAACPGVGTGFYNDPYCDLALALDPVNLAANSEISVWVRAGDPYVGGLGLLTGSSPHFVAIVGIEGRPTVEGGASVMSVATSSNRMFLDNLELTGGTSTGARCSNAGRMWLSDVVLTGNEIGAEGTSNCRLTVDRSLIYDNVSLGMQIGSAVFDMTNTGVIVNGVASSGNPGGVVIDGASNWSILYSTIAGNRGSTDTTGNELSCVLGSPGNVRNSIVMGPSFASDLDCPDGVSDDSVVDLGTNGTVSGNGNTDLAYAPALFVNITAGDLHVRDPGVSELRDLSVWRAGDPTQDIDGDPRPNVDGAPDWPGADVP